MFDGRRRGKLRRPAATLRRDVCERIFSRRRLSSLLRRKGLSPGKMATRGQNLASCCRDQTAWVLRLWRGSSFQGKGRFISSDKPERNRTRFYRPWLRIPSSSAIRVRIHASACGMPVAKSLAAMASPLEALMRPLALLDSPDPEGIELARERRLGRWDVSAAAAR
jgi:hypothetical protein